MTRDVRASVACEPESLASLSSTIQFVFKCAIYTHLGPSQRVGREYCVHRHPFGLPTESGGGYIC